MKIHKASLFTLLALGGLMVAGPIARADDAPDKTPPAAGGDNTAPAGRANRLKAMRDKMLTDIKATDEQKEKLKPIFKEQDEKRAALRGDSSLSREDRTAKMKELTEATDAKVKAVLSADQFKQYQEIQKEMMKRFQNRRRQQGADDAPKN